jgi:phenylalanyl-tRNA synthetase beta subunit
MEGIEDLLKEREIAEENLTNATQAVYRIAGKYIVSVLYITGKLQESPGTTRETIIRGVQRLYDCNIPEEDLTTVMRNMGAQNQINRQRTDKEETYSLISGIPIEVQPIPPRKV